MAFEIRINGETVWKSDRQVTQVSMMTARGEAGRAGISTEGVVDLVVTEVATSGPMRLDQLEALEREANAQRLSGGDQGFVSPENYQPAEDANKLTQGNVAYLHDPALNPETGQVAPYSNMLTSPGTEGTPDGGNVQFSDGNASGSNVDAIETPGTGTDAGDGSGDYETGKADEENDLELNFDPNDPNVSAPSDADFATNGESNNFVDIENQEG